MTVFSCLPKAANAIPAFANRLGVPCKTCHEPTFPRLNRTGWLFRELGYRTIAEMNEPLTPGWVGTNNPTTYNFANTIAVGTVNDFDNTTQTASKSNSDFYVSDLSLYFAGPVESNFGFWVQAQFVAESPSYDPASNTWSTPDGGTTVVPVIRYYNGSSAKSFLYAQIGKIGIDGFEGSDSPIQAAVSELWQTSVNGSSPLQYGSVRGASVGYLLNNDTIAAYAGYQENGLPGNAPVEGLQYLHFIGKHDSSVQAVYVNGSAPAISTDPTGATLSESWENYNQLNLYGNYRTPIGRGNAVNLLGGYFTGENHQLLTTSDASGDALVRSGPSFRVNGYFAEADYEHGNKLIPYVRYDSFHSNGAEPVNINPNLNAYTIGAAYMIEQNICFNLDYNRNAAEGDPPANNTPQQNDSTVRAQIWFMW